ncbi:Glycosyl transferase family 2 [uncultured archaeon]|nr:Glycosyl transferase family 2 [uncultured archaeon]
MAIKISIITSMYNRRNETIDSIEALFFNSIKQHGKKDRELIIIDDHSPLEKETLGLFKKHEKELKSIFGRVIFKRNPTNYGFGKSFNSGIKISKGKFIVIVNDDVYLPKDSVSALTNILSESKTYGILGPITGEKFTWTSQYCKQAPKLESYSKDSFNKIEDFAKYARKKLKGKRIKTDILSGFCFVVSSELIKSHNGFDETFGIGFYEDIDLSRRISSKFDVIIAPEVYVHHGSLKGISTSFNQHPIKKLYSQIRNTARYSRKCGLYSAITFIVKGRYRQTGRNTVSELF